MDRQKTTNLNANTRAILLGVMIMFITFVSFSNVSSYSINVFSNNLDKENLTYSNSTIFYRYLNISTNTLFTNARFNISYLNTSGLAYCYQETFNKTSTRNYGICNFNYSGKFSYSESTGSPDIFINYSKPIGYTVLNATWMIKANFPPADIINLSLNKYNCTNYDNSTIQLWLSLNNISSTYTNFSIYCKNSTNWALLYNVTTEDVHLGAYSNCQSAIGVNKMYDEDWSTGCIRTYNGYWVNGFSTANPALAEEGMFWDINFTTNIYTSNLNISINNKSIFYRPGAFNTTNVTDNFYSLVNSYNSQYCSILESSCNIPISFAANNTGIIQYLYIDVNNLGFVQNNINYSSTTYETKNETLSLNISYDSSLYSSISAELIYNGTRYTSSVSTTSNKAILSNVVDVPLLSSFAVTNVSFYWNIAMTNNTGSTEYYNSSFSNHSINPILFTRCNSTYSVVAVNYTIYNESSFVRTNASFSSTFFYSLGSKNFFKIYTTNLTGNSSYLFCIYPNQTFSVDSNIKLSSSGFFDRNYYLNDKLYSNRTTQEPLYLIDSTARTVIIEFKDISLTALANYFIGISRYYESTNEEIQVHIDKTDNFGQVVTNLIENTVKYRFKFYDPSNNLIKTSNQVVVACRFTVCVITFLEENPVGVLNYNNLNNYAYSFYFNNVTNTFIYSWNDNTGSTPYHSMRIERLSGLGTTTICNLSSTDISSSLSCAVGSNYSSYRAQAFRSASPEKRIGLLNVQVGDISSNFGKEGLMWSFILLIFCICIGIWYPPAGVGLYLVAFILLKIVGVIYSPIEIIIAQIAIGVAFIWAFRG